MTTEWHKLEFLSLGVREPLTGGRVRPAPAPSIADVESDWTPQTVTGVGYYEVEDGKIVRQTDDKGQTLDMNRVHECRIVEILKVAPF